ncbi:MAG TPA: DUF3460 family protein [Burkholderiales bacterium]|nr:DUF3460 family protein [Burkholderiales bacterium]
MAEKNTNYVSDTTKFINELLNKNPQLKKKQKILRNTWWDKNFIDLDEQKDFKESDLPQNGYVYFTYKR